MEERDEKKASPITGNKFWDKVKDSRLFAGLVGALAIMVVGLISYIGTRWIGEKEERSRTFDLLSKREIAAQELQVKVFEVFVQHVVPALDDSVNDHKKVALLAGLHSNFSEYFDTRSVFEAFADKIDDPIARHELRRLAKRVARRQAEYISAHSPKQENEMSIEVTLHWPKEDSITIRNLAVHNVKLSILRPQCKYTIPESDSIKKNYPTFVEEGDTLLDDVSDLVNISIEFTPAHKSKEKMEGSIGPFVFDLSYMDTPYMDNIWMRHHDGSHHQVAVRLIDIDTKIDKDTEKEKYSVKIEILHFPGDIYAATQRLPIKELLQGGHEH